MNAAGSVLCGLVVLLCGLGACREHAQPAEVRDLPRVCTLVDCFDGLTIAVYPHTGWPAGNYRFVIKHDKNTTICEAREPAAPRKRNFENLCNRRSVSMGSVGSEISINEHPAVVDIDVLRDGVRVTSAHFDIAYEEDWPNGRECGTVCRAAIVSLTLPAASIRR